MFIKRKAHRKLLNRLGRIERDMEQLRDELISATTTMVELRSDNAGVLFGFAEDIDEIKTALNDYGDLAKEQREAYIAQVRKDIGFQNMINY